MYYQCLNGTNYWSKQGPTYYVESQDGLNWQKPELADSPFGGYPVTNVVRINDARGTRIQAPWVFHNLTTDDSAKAYAMIYNSVGLRLAYSPEGLIWTPASEEALFNYHSDTHNHVVWNQQLGMWMLYMRPPIFFHEGPSICYYRRQISVSALTYWIGQYYV